METAASRRRTRPNTLTAPPNDWQSPAPHGSEHRNPTVLSHGKTEPESPLLLRPYDSGPVFDLVIASV